MPHIDPERREQLLKGDPIKDWGELHFVIGQVMQEHFLKEPKYNTLRAIHKAFVLQPKENKFLQAVKKSGVHWDDVINETMMAWNEFNEAVVHAYEDTKAKKNGHAYQKSLDLIKELESK